MILNKIFNGLKLKKTKIEAKDPIQDLPAKKEEAKKKLESLADPKCSKCGGIGNLGWNVTHNYWIACKCAQRNYKQQMLDKKLDKASTL